MKDAKESNQVAFVKKCLGRIIDEVHRYTYRYLFIYKDGDILDGVVTRSGSP